jgi:HAD superfamily hydrolase (TIGR01484 family)
MQFISKAQEKAYAQAMKRKYKAVAFDVDGTLTHFGRFLIPPSLGRVLEELPIPIAICSGRRLDYLIGELEFIIHKPNRFAFCENGCIGYKYDYENEKFKKIYEVPWPSKRITPNALEAFMKDKFGWHMHISVRPHSVVAFYPSWFYIFPKLVRKISNSAAKKIRTLLQAMKIDDIIMAKDSGIGNILMPIQGGKGPAMQALAKHLNIPVKSILVIGDQANPGENDEDFLDGKNGTAFTVGKQTKNVYPLPVLDSRQRKLTGPFGTEALLKQLFFTK